MELTYDNMLWKTSLDEIFKRDSLIQLKSPELTFFVLAA